MWLFRMKSSFNLRIVNLNFSLDTHMIHLSLVYTSMDTFENTYFTLRFGLCSEFQATKTEFLKRFWGGDFSKATQNRVCGKLMLSPCTRPLLLCEQQQCRTTSLFTLALPACVPKKVSNYYKLINN